VPSVPKGEESMLDPIIDSKMAKFREKMELGDVPDGIAFERFVNFSILNGHQPGAFNGDSELFDKVNIGGYYDMGIDGIAVKINGMFVRSIEETQSLVEKLPRLDVEFVFIQSKYKEEFTKTDFLSFTSGVRDFLSGKSKMPHAVEIQELIEIKEYLIGEDVISKWNDNPLVRLYYVTMSKEHNSETQKALEATFREDISRLNIYKEPITLFVNRQDFKSILDSNERNFEKTINFIGSMPLTKVDKVDNSCVLLCYAKELKKILKSPDGLIRKSLFDDNVRDFQGNNTINNAINVTIKNEPEKFVLLNNGITIVCEGFTTSNMQINIKNPQIVNGCQTSHVIYNNVDDQLDKTPIIIKLISTENIEITNQIVRGTNSQNIVYSEAFETIKPFHKDLEEFIDALSPTYERFYYERRSKQYDHNPAINYYQKINFRIIIQTLIGMFFNLPHLAHKHESKLLEMYKERIFLDHQSKYPYFTAAFSYYKIEHLFRLGNIEKQYYAFRIHILMIFRELIAGEMQDINDEEAIEKHCKTVLSVLKDNIKALNCFQKAVKIFEEIRQVWIKELRRDQFRIKDVKDFTNLLLFKIDERAHDDVSTPSDRIKVNAVAKKPMVVIKPRPVKPEEKPRYFGKIVHIGFDKNGKTYGHISNDSATDIFFHSAKSPDVDFASKKYCKVSYEIDKNPVLGNDVAVSIKILSEPKFNATISDGSTYKPFVELIKKKNNT
jgi:hypothetical protein